MGVTPTHRRAPTARAVQSVVAGIALSGVGIVLAIMGVLPPIAGAFFQEAIDVAVILNALRALGGGIPRQIGSVPTATGQSTLPRSRRPMKAHVDGSA